MAKDKPTGAKRGEDHPAAAREAGERGTAPIASGGSSSHGGGQHHAASAHGRPIRVDESLPGTRDALMALHAEARRKRGAAPLGSDDYRAAAEEIGRIEVRIAAVDRAADPPRG